MTRNKYSKLELMVEPVSSDIYFSKDSFLVPSKPITSDDSHHIDYEEDHDSLSYNRAREIIHNITYFTFREQGFFEDDPPERLNKKIGSLPKYFIAVYNPDKVVKLPDPNSRSQDLFSYKLSDEDFDSEKQTLERVINDKKEELEEFVNKSKLGRFFYIHPLTVPIWTTVGIFTACSMKTISYSSSKIIWQIPLILTVSAVGLVVDLESSESQEMEHVFGLEYDKKRIDLLNKLKVADISELAKRRKFNKK